MARPELLDNLGDETRHGEALAYLIGDVDAKYPLAVATGYVNLEGLHRLAEILDGRPVRLMIGAAPEPGLGAPPPPIDRFRLQLEALRDERNFSRFPPSRAAKRLAAVEEWLSGPEIEVRRFTQKFLHGKAYLFGDTDDPRVALVTSANLTGAGLSRNLELGLAQYQPEVTRRAIEWFDLLWGEAVDFRDELRALLFPDPGLVDPASVYLRALLELHPPEPDDPNRASRPTGLELAPFQRDGYERARVIAHRHGGVIYADGVGTGKTEIGLAFIEERTKESGVFALVIAPAQLKKRWQERIRQAKLSAHVISFQELASDEQLAPDAHRHLDVDKDAYRLVLVDEAHALRNEDTSWYRAIERLLGGSTKQAVLLTATPINNGLWDLYNMVMLFARHDRAFSAIGLDSVRNLFLAAGANERDPENLSPDVLYPLADAVSVRRDRTFIETNYQGAVFPDGTPVRFPTPSLRTHRYDLDEAHPGLFESIADEIDSLTMARYRPSAFELSGGEENAEAQLAGLLKSGLLKRFESCWRACLATVEHMLSAHEAFLLAWERGEVLSREDLRRAAAEEVDEAGLATWLDERLEGDGSRPAEEFDPEFGPAVAADRDCLAAIAEELSRLGSEDDPKLALLGRLLEESPAEKIAVFSTYGATVRYLDEKLPELVAGRKRVVVIGGETTPDERTRALSRFAPNTVVREGYEPPDGEVDLLLSTDVLSEGQNLQQAQAVISYDMPWNPQRVVQRNGRVIRLRSPHAEVFLTTMLPAAGELERLLGLEARIQAKIKAASGVFGMESEVIEGIESEIEAELRNFAERLTGGDPELIGEAEEESGAFVGEELRRLIDRALAEGEVERVSRLPWGIGACFRQTSSGRSRGTPGVFFATRTPPMTDMKDGYRYWRYVELGSGELVSGDLEILRRIDPHGGEPTEPDEVDLDAMWESAAASIVAQHNERADLRARQEQIGPRQRWALGLLRDPSVSLPVAAEQIDAADAALSVERSSAVRRALREVQEQLEDAAISRDSAAVAIIDVVQDFGLRPIEPPPLPEKVSADDLGVVCWMVVLPPSD